jgi:serpin B
MQRLSLILVLTLALAGPATAEKERRAAADALVAGNAAFAWDLYGALRAGDTNLFFSPYSVSSALMMTREGARGETAAQMDKVLHLAGLDRGTAHMALRSAMTAPLVREGWGKEAKRLPAYELSIANRLWGQEGYAFEPDFFVTLAKIYKAPLERVDFGKPELVRKAINDWVARRTKDKIQNIVPEGMPPPLSVLALANAIYFKAQWQDPFFERNTKEEDFIGPGGKKTKAQLMHRVGSYRYTEIDGVQVLELPYRSGAASMVIFLPRAMDGLAAVEDKLVGGAAKAWIDQLKSQKVDVRLPKFEFSCFKDLTKVLPAMGMPSAFKLPDADFSGMTKKEKLFIGAVLHKAFVAVDEKGTEAAAATVVMMKRGAAPRPSKPVEFRADHPFAFVIRHPQTGTILFAGRVNTP